MTDVLRTYQCRFTETLTLQVGCEAASESHLQEHLGHQEVTQPQQTSLPQVGDFNNKPGYFHRITLKNIEHINIYKAFVTYYFTYSHDYFVQSKIKIYRQKKY